MDPQDVQLRTRLATFLHENRIGDHPLILPPLYLLKAFAFGGKPLGLPPLRPLALAAVKTAWALFRIMARSNSVNEANRCYVPQYSRRFIPPYLR